MATETTNTAATSNLLDPNQQTVCASVATTKAPHKQRALALLAINSGKNTSQAAEESGLTVGQVRYWLGRFRKLGLDIFPADISKESTGQASAKEKAKDVVKPAAKTTADDQAAKSKKAKKQKSEKTKQKKDKKGKKDKKQKKGKRQKKK